eukprot:6214653-Pleurochrysis_carterae.AAC.1
MQKGGKYGAPRNSSEVNQAQAGEPQLSSEIVQTATVSGTLSNGVALQRVRQVWEQLPFA